MGKGDKLRQAKQLWLDSGCAIGEKELGFLVMAGAT